MNVGRDVHGVVHLVFWKGNTLFNKARCDYTVEVIMRDADTDEHVTCLACVANEVAKRTT